VVKAKQAAAEEMAVASGVKYLMYAGSRITSSHILDDIPITF
jgi:type III restriction enzyme